MLIESHVRSAITMEEWVMSFSPDFSGDVPSTDEDDEEGDAIFSRRRGWRESIGKGKGNGKDKGKDSLWISSEDVEWMAKNYPTTV